MEHWNERLSEASMERRRRGSRKRADQFLAGPIPVDWIVKSVGINPTAAVAGLALWFRSGCERSRTIKAGRSLWSRFGLTRHQGSRALSALESAGLVTVKRHRGRNPIVTIKAKGKRNGHHD